MERCPKPYFCLCIVTRSILCAGLEMFRPSCMYCVSVVRRVVVECRALKQCGIGVG